MKIFKMTCYAALACATVMPMGASARDTITAATWLPPQHQYSRYLYTYWADRLDHHSGGSLTANVELGSARVTATGNLSEIADGLADVSGHFAQYTPSDLPVSNALEELGMTYDDPRVIIAAATEFNIKEPMLIAEWGGHGVVFGGSYITNHYKLICNKPIRNLEELKGAKLRLPGRAPAEWANSAGAATVSPHFGAIQRRMARTSTVEIPSTAKPCFC